MIKTVILGSLSPDSADLSIGSSVDLQYSSGLSSGYGSGLTPISGLEGHLLASMPSAGEGGNLGSLLYHPSPAGGNYHHFVHGGDFKLYKADIESPGSAYSEVGAGTILSMNPGRSPFIQWGTDIIFSSGLQEPRMMINNSGDFVTFMTGTYKPRGVFLGIVNNHLVMSRIATSNKYDYVSWSALNDPASWDASVATGAGEQRLIDTPGPITGMYCGDVGLVFKKTGIYLLTYEGHPWTFSVRLLSSTYGTIYPRSIIGKNGVVYFLGADGFKRVSAEGGVEEIGSGTIEWFLRSEQSANSYMPHHTSATDDMQTGIRAAYDHNSGQIWWFYTSRNSPSAEDGPGDRTMNCALIYDERDNKFYFHRDDSTQIQDVTAGPFQTNHLDPTTPGSSIPILSSDTFSRYVSPISVPFSLKTKVIMVDESHSVFVRAVRIISRLGDGVVTHPDCQFTVYTSNDPYMTANVTTTTQAVFTEDGWAPITAEGQFVRIEFSGGLDDGDVREFDAIQIDYEIGSNRSA